MTAPPPSSYLLTTFFYFGERIKLRLKVASLMYVSDIGSGIGSHQSVINVKKRSASGTMATPPPPS